VDEEERVIPAKRRLQPGQRVRAIVVDDSAVLRQLVVRTLERDHDIEVVASAPNGPVAIDRIAKLQPDVVSLDLELPDMSGLDTLRNIRRNFPDIRVVMFSSQTERGAASTFEALSLGADDYVTKFGSAESGNLGAGLASKIKQFFVFPSELSAPPLPSMKDLPPPVDPCAANPRCSIECPKIILIGISTGGPEALTAVLPQIPADFQLPILIVQHMPPLFTRFLCDRLQDVSKLPVREARHGEKLDSPKILLAPGDFHMRLAPPASGSLPGILLDQGPLENSCRPAADALFRSAAQILGGAALAIVMTGMGQDGLRGAAALKAVGAFVIAQDESSSAVWGMPRAVVEAGLADLVVPLKRIVPAMLNRVLLLSRAENSQPKDKSIAVVKS
jgi:two-component system chemotaxis response regulator CheB